MKKCTGQDIARMAHVNQSTVSRALSPARAWMISFEKRREILELCKKHNYLPRQDAARPALRKTFNVCWLLGRMENDLTMNSFSFMLRYVCDYLQQSGYSLTLIRIDYTRSDHGTTTRHILRSNTADIYIAGAGLLRDQTLDLLHEMSSRLICCTPFCSPVLKGEQYHWISRLDFDYAGAFRSAARIIPKELFSSMIYLDQENSTGREKYSFVRRMIAENRLPESPDPPFFHDGRRCLWDQAYRAYRCWLDQIRPGIEGRKLYWCGSNILAQALTDLLQESGLRPDRDFFVVTFGALCDTAEKYRIFPDPCSVIYYQVEQLGHLLCEQIMSLIENPMPQNTIVPVAFLPSPALGGGAPRQII